MATTPSAASCGPQTGTAVCRDKAPVLVLVLVLVPVPVPVLVPGTHCSTRENEDCARRARQGRDPSPPALACETIMKRNTNRSLDGFLSRLAPLHHGRGNDFRIGESGEIEQRRAAGSWREEMELRKWWEGLEGPLGSER